MPTTLATVLCSLALSLQSGGDPSPPAAPPVAEPAPSAKADASDDSLDPDVARDLTHFNLDEKGLALQGYDPVAYFEEFGGKATRGKESIHYRYRGVTYRFASERNRKAFLAAPAKYEPAYGGYCAYGAAKEYKVEIDPESFLIVEGRLMLFYDGFLNDTRASWLEAGSAKLKPKADAYWQKLSAERATEPKRGA
jgi:YHS domain-containing protein